MFQGLCMTSVLPTLKGDAFTIAHIFSLLYSNGIAPVLFGLFYNNNKYKKLSLYLLFEIYLGIGAILLPILIYLVVKKNKAALPGNRTTAFRYELKTAVNKLAWSYDGKKLAAGDINGHIAIFASEKDVVNVKIEDINKFEKVISGIKENYQLELEKKQKKENK